MSDAQFVAFAMGAHPYRVCRLHWHAVDYRPLLTRSASIGSSAGRSSRTTWTVCAGAKSSTSTGTTSMADTQLGAEPMAEAAAAEGKR